MPYVSPKPRQRVALAQAPFAESEPSSSATTPSFAKSGSESATTSHAYTPRHAAASPATANADSHNIITSSSPIPDPTDPITNSSPSRANTPSINPSLISKRSSWSHRKPVPSNIILPVNSIPSSHPFARSTPSPRSQHDLGHPPVSPRLFGPVPPRRPGVHNRSISNLASPCSPAGSDLSEGSGLFWRPPVPEIRDAQDLEGTEEVLAPEDSDTAPISVESAGGHKSGPPTIIPSRRSSRYSTQTATPELGPPVTLGNDNGASSATTYESKAGAAPTTTARHPLRLRMDKSLPSLPLNQDEESVAGSRVSRHKASTSTSSGPSTQIVTPRSESRAFALGDSDDRAANLENRKAKWTKGLTELSWIKREKEPKVTSDSNANSENRSSAQDDEEIAPFSVHGIPSKRRLMEASTLFLTDENGDQVSFGDMFPQSPPPSSDNTAQPVPRTVVFFIRTFWCGQCQDYMFASMSQLDPVAIEKAGIRVIVISNGSWKIIKSYKKLFKCPFPIYVDGPRKLYQLFGMTKLTNDFGPMVKGRAAYNQRPVPTQVVLGVKNALTKMPIANPGKLTQLGGEFVLSPGYNCDFAHRMTNRSNHMEAPDVLREAGCAHPTKAEVEEITIAENQRAELERLEIEMQEWRHQRETELDRIRRRKAERRGEEYIPVTSPSMTALEMDERLDQERGFERSRESLSPRGHAAVSLPNKTPAVDDEETMRVGSAQNDLTWEDDEETSADINGIFEEIVRSGQLELITTGRPAKDEGSYTIEEKELKPPISKGEFAGATSGRKASGTGSGLEVRVVD